MNIQNIKYENEEQTRIRVTCDDCTVITQAKECSTFNYTLIQEWLDEGNTIEPYE